MENGELRTENCGRGGKDTRPGLRAARGTVSGFALRAILALAALTLTSGCNYFMGGYKLVSIAPIVPPRGFLYSHYKAPLVLPVPRDMGEAPESKGRVLYIKIPTPYLNTEFSLGRADIEAACREAGIKTLIGADYEYRSVAGYVKTFTIHAYGYPDEEGRSAGAGGN